MELLATEFEVDNVQELGYTVISFAVGPFSDISFVFTPLFETLEKKDFFLEEFANVSEILISKKGKLESRDFDQDNFIETSRILKFLKNSIPACNLNVLTFLSSSVENFELNYMLAQLTHQLRREIKIAKGSLQASQNHNALESKNSLGSNPLEDNRDGYGAVENYAEDLISEINEFSLRIFV